MAASSEQKMPMFNLKSMTFAQYIDDVFEIKSWGFDWDANKKLKLLALIYQPDGARKYSVIFTVTIRSHTIC